MRCPKVERNSCTDSYLFSLLNCAVQVSVPLVYTQLVTLAVYFYFAAALFGAQWVQPERSEAYQVRSVVY